jgi:hypothetical protein
MARLRLLDGPAEEIPCIVIEAEGLEEKAAHAASLRSEAKRLQAVWLANGTDLEAKAAFARALRVWAEYVGNTEAAMHANRLINGYI